MMIRAKWLLVVKAMHFGASLLNHPMAAQNAIMVTKKWLSWLQEGSNILTMNTGISLQSSLSVPSNRNKALWTHLLPKQHLSRIGSSIYLILVTFIPRTRRLETLKTNNSKT